MMIHTDTILSITEASQVNKNEYVDDAELLMVSNKLITKKHKAYSVLTKQKTYSDVVTVEDT